MPKTFNADYKAFGKTFSSTKATCKNDYVKTVANEQPESFHLSQRTKSRTKSMMLAYLTS